MNVDEYINDSVENEVIEPKTDEVKTHTVENEVTSKKGVNSAISGEIMIDTLMKT